MTDRLHSLTVVLDHNCRDDDAESLILAIMQFRGVCGVKGNVADSESYMAETRAKMELRKALFKVLETDEGG